MLPLAELNMRLKRSREDELARKDRLRTNAGLQRRTLSPAVRPLSVGTQEKLPRPGTTADMGLQPMLSPASGVESLKNPSQGLFSVSKVPELVAQEVDTAMSATRLSRSSSRLAKLEKDQSHTDTEVTHEASPMSYLEVNKIKPGAQRNYMKALSLFLVFALVALCDMVPTPPVVGLSTWLCPWAHYLSQL